GLQVAEGTDRGFNAVADVPQEPPGRATVADPVIEGQRQLAHLAHRDLAIDHPRAADEAADAEDGHLGMIDDRGGTVDAEYAVVVDGEGAAGQAGRSQGTVAGRRGL